MTYLIYAPGISGHNIEYLGHIWKHICVGRPEDSFVFVTPGRFPSVVAELGWPELPNVRFDCYSDEEAEVLDSDRKLARSRMICRVLRARIRRHHADMVYVQFLIETLPLAPFLLPRKARMTGIIYKIYLYEWKESSRLRKLAHVCKYWLFAHSKRYASVLLLNDPVSARLLCSLYRTDKFRSITDPFMELQRKGESFRALHGIADDAVVLSHFGTLQRRKGTMAIVESLKLLDAQERSRYVFVFAGKVMEDIKEEFYRKMDGIREVRTVVLDGFLPYDELADLIVASDALLIPYLETGQSSGLVAYASEFGVPVVAPASGMIGKLVRRYHLGLTIPEVSPDALHAAYGKIQDVGRPGTAYCESHTVTEFTSVLSDALR